jgi:hypothetical protein
MRVRLFGINKHKKTKNGRDFFTLIRKCVCACLQFNHKSNFCVRNDKLKFFNNNFKNVFLWYNIPLLK